MTASTDLYVFGNFAYVADGSGGLRIFEILTSYECIVGIRAFDGSLGTNQNSTVTVFGG